MPAKPFTNLSVRRSPNYPSIGLPEAVSLLRKIHEKVGLERVSEDQLAEALGYTARSSWLNLLLSSLVKFGLLDAVPGGGGQPRSYEITESGADLVGRATGSTLHEMALQRAALRPAIYRDLWERFGPELPETDHEMVTYLVTERKFKSTAATKLLSDFRSTAAMATLKSRPNESPVVDGAMLDAFLKMNLPQSENAPSAPVASEKDFLSGRIFPRGAELEKLRRAMLKESKERITVIPLADGETATITMPKKMTPQSWQMLIDTLELWKKQAEAAE